MVGDMKNGRSLLFFFFKTPPPKGVFAIGFFFNVCPAGWAFTAPAYESGLDEVTYNFLFFVPFFLFGEQGHALMFFWETEGLRSQYQPLLSSTLYFLSFPPPPPPPVFFFFFGDVLVRQFFSG